MLSVVLWRVGGGHNGVYRWFMGGGVSSCRRRGDGGCRFARWHLLG